MTVKFGCSALLVMVISLAAETAKKPRVFITESGAAQATGEANMGATKGSLAFTGGTSPENIEVMKAFSQRCPGVIVTADPKMADYTIRLDHEQVNPTTPFVHGNKVAVFNKRQDLVFSNSTRTLRSAVKDACLAITTKNQ